MNTKLTEQLLNQLFNEEEQKQLNKDLVFVLTNTFYRKLKERLGSKADSFFEIEKSGNMENMKSFLQKEEIDIKVITDSIIESLGNEFNDILSKNLNDISQ